MTTINEVIVDILNLSQKTSDQKLPVFGTYPFRDSRQQLGQLIPESALPTCIGHVDGSDAITGEGRFVRIRGWMYNAADKSTPQFIKIVGTQGTVAGYALTGQPRNDVADAIDKQAPASGFAGYLLADKMEGVLLLQGERSSCLMRSPIPVPATLGK